jgi:23S rRNA (guanine1835-N2)-methyltransferase
MNTEFILADRQFTLIRYPEKHQHVSLQAWDSADELLINHVEAALSDKPLDGPMVIFNDDFGAIGCWFTHYNPIWISDSYIALRSLRENLALNKVTPEVTADGAITSPVQSLTSVESLHISTPRAPAMILIKVPRTLALLEQQLIDIKRVATANTRIIAAGKAKNITRTVLSLFEKILGITTTSLAKKKSRLIFCELDETKADVPSPYPTTWPCTLPTGQTVQLANLANVFSRQSLDIGARIMLPHMTVSSNDIVVDLGCGNGVLGLQALSMAPDCKVIFVDESFMAVESARHNVLTNFPDKIDQCEFIASNCLEALLERSDRPAVTKVLCNPPFHQQNAITDHIAWQMFQDARELLVRSGHLIVVGNRHLEYHIKLKRLFGGTNIIASDNKFVILGTAKR